MKAVCVVTDEGDGVLELKNLAVSPGCQQCGFRRPHVIKNFFTDNYDHPIIECGKQLFYMVYLKKKLKATDSTCEN